MAMTSPQTVSPPTCGDCGVLEGQLHAYFPNCDQEVCPLCLAQLCGCEHRTQLARIQRKGRIPFIFFPLLCAKCGTIDPDFFSVPTAEWHRVVPRSHWETILCRSCYAYLETLAPPLLPKKPRPIPVDPQSPRFL